MLSGIAEIVFFQKKSSSLDFSHRQTHFFVKTLSAYLMTSSISELKLGPLVSQNPPHLFYHLQHTHIERFCELAQNHL